MTLTATSFMGVSSSFSSTIPSVLTEHFVVCVKIEIASSFVQRFSDDCRKTNITKQLLWPITTWANSAMNQSQFLAITFHCSKRGKNHAYIMRLVLVLLLIGWKTGASFFELITKCGNRNHVITLDNHLKTALSNQKLICSVTKWISVLPRSTWQGCVLFSIGR